MNPPDKPTNPPDKSTNPPDKSTNPVTVFSKMCYPAQYFIILSSIYLFYSLFVSIGVQNKFNVKVISLTLIILSLIVIGWAYIVNFMCDTKDNYIAWGLALIPLMLYALRS